MLVFFTNISLMELYVRYLALLLLFSVIGSFGFYWKRNLQRIFKLILASLKGFILGPACFLLYINDLHVICNIGIYADDTIRYSKCEQASDLWQLLELAWIWSTRHWTGAGSGWVISMMEKLNYFRLTCFITLVLLMLKRMGLFLRKNNLLGCWDWLSLLNWIGVLTLSLLLKLPPRKFEPWFVLWSLFLLRLLCIAINLPYGHIWNTVVMSGWCS